MATESVVVYLFGQLALAVPRCTWPTRLVRSSTGCWSEVDILVSGILFAQIFIRFNLKALANHILKIYTIFSELVIQRSSSTFNPEACSLSSLWLNGRPFARLGCNIFQSSTDDSRIFLWTMLSQPNEAEVTGGGLTRRSYVYADTNTSWHRLILFPFTSELVRSSLLVYFTSRRSSSWCPGSFA